MGDPNDNSNAPESHNGSVEFGKERKETPKERQQRLKKEKEAKEKTVHERTALRTNIELEPPMTHYYELGEYEDAEVEGKYETVEGSVDGTPYPARIYKEKFYEDKAKAAKLLLKVYENQRERFTDPSQELIKKHLPMIRKLAKQNDFDPGKFKASFEKGYSAEQVFGTNGIYNFVLTFQRVMDAYAHDEANLLSSKARISLKVGEAIKSKEERYVRTVSGKGEQPSPTPAPRTKPGTKPDTSKPKPEEYPEIGKQGKGKDYIVAGSGPGMLAPGAEKFLEQIDVKATSTKLIESYTATGMIALVSGLNKIPEGQRQDVLNEIFKKLGEKDPKKAFEVMKEVIKYEKGERETALVKGLQEKIETSTTENEKNYWRVQLTLFEMGQTDDKGVPKLSPSKSQGKMREVFRLLSEVSIESLPDALQEMARQQKTYLETSMRRNLSADMIETATLSLEAMMKNKKDSDTYVETSFESLKKESRQKIATDLDNWYDSDAEVYMAASHVFEALRLLIAHQYPKDAQNEEILNPVEHYYNKLMNGEITEIKLEEGEAAIVNDVLLDNPVTKTGPGTIDLTSIFVDIKKEKNLYEQYENGEEKLGEDGLYNGIVDTRDRVFGAIGVPKGWRTAAGYIAAAATGPLAAGFLVQQALGDIFSDNRKTFLETKDKGFIKATSGILPGKGKLHEFMKNIQGNAEDLGAVEKLQIEKLKQLFAMKHYDEARALCIQILQDRLGAKLKIRPETMLTTTELFKDMKEDYGGKIGAQVRIRLRQEGIDESSIEGKQIPKPSGGFYTNLDEYVNDKIETVLKERAYVQVQGVAAEELTEAEVSTFTAYEKEAYEMLSELNGHGPWDLKEETFDIVKDVTQIVVEFAIIELATWGMGTIPAVANLSARIGSLGLRAAAWAARAPRIGSYLVRTGELGVSAGRNIGKAFIFVEAQSAMHGRLVDPTTANGAYQIAVMAATFGAAGKAQQLMRGTTTGAKAAAEAVPEGLARLNPLSEIGRRFGQVNRWLRGKGAIGSTTASAMEISGEIGALHMLGYAEQEVTSNLDDIAKFMKLEEMGLIEKGTSQRLKEYAEHRQAMKDPNTWHNLAHTAGIVLGLRAGARLVKGKADVLGEIPVTKTVKLGESTFRPNEKIMVQGPTGEPVEVRVVGTEQVVITPDIIATRLRVKVEGGKEMVVKAGEIIPPKTVGERLERLRDKTKRAGGKLREKLRRNKGENDIPLDREGRIILPTKISGRRAKIKAEQAKEKPEISAAAEKADAKPQKSAEKLSQEVADAAGKAVVARENALSSSNPERAGEFARIAGKAADQAEASAKTAAESAKGTSEKSKASESAKKSALMAEGARESARIARRAATQKALESKYGDEAPKVAEILEKYLVRTEKMRDWGSETTAEFRQKIMEALNVQPKVTDRRYERRFDDVKAEFLRRKKK